MLERIFMKINLKLKLFIFSIIILICFISLFAFSIAVSVKNFDYNNEKEEAKNLDSLIKTLKVYYSRNGGWGNLKDNIQLWDLILKTKDSKGDLQDIPDYLNEINKNNSKDNDDIVFWATNPLSFEYRVSLLDEKKKFVIGRTSTLIEGASNFEIEENGKSIGWLNFKESKNFHLPLDRAFTEDRIRIYYILGGVYLFILISITVLFSKNILRPITQLADATKRLSQLNFNIRIPIKSSDELGELAGRFNDMAQKLEEYERNQKQWLTDTSHELRTPLSVLICQIDALSDGIQKPDKRSLTTLGNEARHLMKLVNDLNDISLIESGALVLKKKLLKPLPILSEDVYVFQKRFESNDMLIEFEFDEGATDLQILGDYDRLKQLFSNILENAVRYTKKPGKLIIRQTLNSGRIKFIFEDSGPGVLDEDLPFLFNRFYRVDSSRSRKTGGSGLGLAICKSIVEMHNGMIRAKNVQGGGLMIEVSLPIESNPSCLMDERTDINKQVNLK
jgi:two-component system, OmpR family, sensor histidine kinase BaeS